ncbi:TPA: hypothetical protein ACM7T7_001151 [Streptococcus pyogenes]
MKTRSKRFLNLATLCLALLGTTLLMAQLVKAEGESPDSSTLLMSAGDEVTDEQDSYIEELYRNDLSLDKDGFKEYLKDEDSRHRFEGFKDGYKAGFDPNAEGIDDDTLYEKAKDEAEAKGKGNEYSDGYQSGYSDGFRDGHPVKAFLGAVWGFLTSIVESWFS